MAWLLLAAATLTAFFFCSCGSLLHWLLHDFENQVTWPQAVSLVFYLSCLVVSVFILVRLPAGMSSTLWPISVWFGFFAFCLVQWTWKFLPGAAAIVHWCVFDFPAVLVTAVFQFQRGFRNRRLNVFAILRTVVTPVDLEISTDELAGESDEWYLWENDHDHENIKTDS